jgi:hypothetical protein
MFLGIVALLLFIVGCIAFANGVNNGVQRYNQQNPTCTMNNPSWPNC